MTGQQLKEYCEAEFENIDAVIGELFSVVKTSRAKYSTADLAAIATFIHNFYNGIENILKRITIYEKIEIKDSPTWHKDLLLVSTDKGVIAEDLYHTLSDYLSFRHFFVHAYSFNLRWEELEPLVNGLKAMHKKFKTSIFDYID